MGQFHQQFMKSFLALANCHLPKKYKEEALKSTEKLRKTLVYC